MKKEKYNIKLCVLTEKLTNTLKMAVTYLASCFIKDQICKSDLLELQIWFKILMATWSPSLPISTSMVLSSCPPPPFSHSIYTSFFFRIFVNIKFLYTSVSGIKHIGTLNFTLDFRYGFWVYSIFFKDAVTNQNSTEVRDKILYIC